MIQYLTYFSLYQLSPFPPTPSLCQYVLEFSQNRALPTAIHHRMLEITNKEPTSCEKIMLRLAFPLTSFHFQMPHPIRISNDSSVPLLSLVILYGARGKA